jgi:hypothetical protein
MRASAGQDERAMSDRGWLERIEATTDPTPEAGERTDPATRFCRELARAAPAPDPAFQQHLERRLLARRARREGPVVRAGHARGALAGGSRGRLPAPAWIAVAAFALLLSAVIAVPVVARAVTRLPHSAPREVAALPTPEAVTTAPVSTGPHAMTLDEIAATVGFAPLVPTYLPADARCGVSDGFAWRDIRVASLNYTCVRLHQQAPRGSSPEQPYVGVGATEEVTVGGQPAIYIHGAWVEEQGQRVWKEGFAQELILERDGLIIHLLAGNTAVMSKDELIRVAASLRPYK